MKKVCLLFVIVFIFACSKSKSNSNTEALKVVESIEMLDESIPNVCENLPEELFSIFPMKNAQGELLTGICRFDDGYFTVEYDLKDGYIINKARMFNANGELFTRWEIDADGKVYYITKFFDSKGKEIDFRDLSDQDGIIYYKNKPFNGAINTYYPDNTTVYVATEVIKGKRTLTGKAYRYDGSFWLDLDFNEEDLSDQIKNYQQID